MLCFCNAVDDIAVCVYIASHGSSAIFKSFSKRCVNLTLDPPNYDEGQTLHRGNIEPLSQRQLNGRLVIEFTAVQLFAQLAGVFQNMRRWLRTIHYIIIGSLIDK